MFEIYQSQNLVSQYLKWIYHRGENPLHGSEITGGARHRTAQGTRICTFRWSHEGIAAYVRFQHRQTWPAL